MATLASLREGLRSGTLGLSAIYSDVQAAESRVERLLTLFENDFGGEGEVFLFSSPGRTEIGGNHTDHSFGCVLAGAVDLDTLALARPSKEPVIRLHSVGFARNTVALDALSPEEGGSSSDRLIRGVCAGFARRALPIGGFCAVTHSNVPPGSGLSSSAAFENLVGIILNCFYGEGELAPAELAKIGQFAENIYINKPSGLMDQTASAVGGLMVMDFKNPEQPKLEPIEFNDFEHTLFITGPIGSHADGAADYASIPREMHQVAWALGVETLRGVTVDDFQLALPSLWQSLPDRAILRAYHFIRENERVELQAKALRKKNYQDFLRLVNESGRSSYMYLQNVISAEEQGLGVALALSESLLCGRGAFRVHGGGFAGTVQAFVPNDLAEEYKKVMESVFGAERCVAVNIRKQGAMRVL